MLSWILMLISLFFSVDRCVEWVQSLLSVPSTIPQRTSMTSMASMALAISVSIPVMVSLISAFLG